MAKLDIEIEEMISTIIDTIADDAYEGWPEYWANDGPRAEVSARIHKALDDWRIEAVVAAENAHD